MLADATVSLLAVFVVVMYVVNPPTVMLPNANGGEMTEPGIHLQRIGPPTRYD